MSSQYAVGQLVQLKKGHPCGANRWCIIRIGMDFRLKCTSCGRSVMMPRAQFMRRVVRVLEDEDDAK